MTAIQFRIGEINILCTNADRSLSFYRDILGFTVEAEEDGCWHLCCGDTRFLLLPFASPRSSPAAYCSEPVYSIDVVTTDLAVAMEYMKANNVDIMKDPSPNEDRFFIRDPDGLPIEVIKEKLVNTIEGN